MPGGGVSGGEQRRAPSRLGYWAGAQVTGVVVVVAGLAWTLVAAIQWDADPVPTSVALYVAPAGAYLVAGLAARLDVAAVPLVVIAAGAAVVAVWTPAEVYSSKPLDGPFEYSNATGSFFVQCAFGAALLLFDDRVVLRVVGLAAALAFVAVPFATDTTSVVVLLALVPAVWIGRSVIGTRRTITMCGVAFGVAVLASILVAATYSGADPRLPGTTLSGTDRMIDATVSLRRIELAHDALELTREHPVTGIGPDRFDDVSVAALADADSPYAHNGYLQAGAETGVPGLVALVLLFTWGFVRVSRFVYQRRRSAMVAVALLVLGAHACVEYVLEYWAIPAVAAALVGCAVTRRPASRARARAAHAL